MAILTLLFPYSMEGPIGSTELSPVSGYLSDLGLLQFAIYIVIIGVSSFKQNLATAAIGLVFCFAFFLYFILLSSAILFDFEKTIELGIGFYLAIGIAVVFWLCHIFNLIIIIKQFSRKDQNHKAELLDSI
ncbi:MAG: hypothetical protein ACI865_003382 [Flavobacteriaceae bacterium]|jgi:hypothetical protein